MIRYERHGAIAELTIHHEKMQNPFTQEMTRQLIRACERAESEDDVSGVLLWGGLGRSFSVGGDFNDVRNLTEEQQCREYVIEIVQSYIGVLSITKPVVVAVDHYAIGQGLQVALMGDWLVGSERSSYHMPELENGVACPLGSVILESLLGRAAMLELVIGCGVLTAHDARERGLIRQVVDHDRLQSAALERLEALLRFPELPFRLTKEVNNRRFIRELEEVAETAARVHAACMASGAGQEHFGKILRAR